MSPELGRVRKALPVTEDCVYLSTGSWGPVSQIFSQTLRRSMLTELREGRMNQPRFDSIESSTAQIRQALASLLKVPADEIALTRSTSASLAAVIEGFPWQPGDEVVCTQLEHPACTGPLSRGASQGRFNVVLAQVPEFDADNLQWLEQCVTSRTRLIAITGVSFETGQRLPVEQIGAFAREHGIYTLLDGAQIVGAIPLDLHQAAIDFCAFPLQKWLLGPDGIGGLYVRQGSLDELRRDAMTQMRSVLEATVAHLDWMQSSIGWEFIHERTRALAASLRAGFAELPEVHVITPSDHAGLITIDAAKGSSDAISARLRRRRINLRSWPELDRYRISTAFFNTDKEIASVLRVFS